MRMKLDAAQIDDPGEARGVVDNDFFGGSAGGECQRYGPQPGGTFGGGALLIKSLPFSSVHETFQYDRTIADSAESSRRDGQIVSHQIELRKLGLFREIEFFRMRHADIAAVDRKQFDVFFFAHRHRLPLSCRLPLSSSPYFIFLAAIFLAYWPLARVRTLALIVILFANYFFWAKWDVVYLGLIPAVATCDYFFGLGLQSFKRPWVRRMLVSASVLMNLGILATFKYTPFFFDNWSHFTGRPAPIWRWTLPISLSFYVFQALTYTIDLYRRDAKGTKSYLAHLAAVSFFPTALAGPITRVQVLLDQFEKPKKLNPADGGRALFLIGLGLTKKLLIADYLGANLVNRVFDFPNLYSGGETLMAVYAFTLELYYDFSGYTDIARGSALLLGINLPLNFKMPYAAVNVADFWRRWHITLSDWLRDYLYFSLPGKRTKVMPYVNLIITMVLGGLWHGASWNFVIWGTLHGVGLAVVRLWQVVRGHKKAQGFVRYLSIFVTLHFVVFAWIFFRAPDWAGAIAILSRLASLSWSLANVSVPVGMVMAIGAIAHYLPKKWYDWSLNVYTRAPFYVQAAALIALAIGLNYVAQTGAAPFIYQKF